jgi:hypothetical protein
MESLLILIKKLIRLKRFSVSNSGLRSLDMEPDANILTLSQSIRVAFSQREPTQEKFTYGSSILGASEKESQMDTSPGSTLLNSTKSLTTVLNSLLVATSL